MIHTVVRLMVLDNVDLVLLKLTFFASDDLAEVGLGELRLAGGRRAFRAPAERSDDVGHVSLVDGRAVGGDRPQASLSGVRAGRDAVRDHAKGAP